MGEKSHGPNPACGSRSLTCNFEILKESDSPSRWQPGAPRFHTDASVLQDGWVSDSDLFDVIALRGLVQLVPNGSASAHAGFRLMIEALCVIGEDVLRLGEDDVLGEIVRQAPCWVLSIFGMYSVSRD